MKTILRGVLTFMYDSTINEDRDVPSIGCVVTGNHG